MKAFITGITGQDGSYLAELLLEKGYEVHGLIRRSSNFNTTRIDHIFDKLNLHHGDCTDGMRLQELITNIVPDEVYNLAAQSHVKVSFDMPLHTVDVTALGTLRLLEAVRHLKNNVKFYQASSSEMFGNSPSPQSETTPFKPRSPYACAKLYSHHQVINYREAYGLFGCCGILFNHESERRGETFVTRKITKAIARIQLGLQSELYLGNLDAQRDWGYSKDYVEAMWLMLQHNEPDDYVVATGETHSVKDFLTIAFGHANLDWEKYVRINEKFFRPSEVNRLQGDASKARNKLNWIPKTSFSDMVKKMVDHDCEMTKRSIQ